MEKWLVLVYAKGTSRCSVAIYRFLGFIVQKPRSGYHDMDLCQFRSTFVDLEVTYPFDLSLFFWLPEISSEIMMLLACRTDKAFKNTCIRVLSI